MALFEAPAASITTALTVTAGTTGYKSIKGDSAYGTAKGTLSIDNLGVYNIYEIDVTGNLISVIITGEFDNGTVLQPWINGLSFSIDAGVTVYTLLPEASTDYSYSLVDAVLAPAFAANIAALDIITL